MKLGIMQPYFLPYIGYFQLIASVDKFVIYDNIKYTKKGWINRNRMLKNGADKVFSLPLAKASDSLDIIERELAADFAREKLLNQFRGSYNKAPYFSDVWPIIEGLVRSKDNNLFWYIASSISAICDYLDITTEILVSSDIDAEHDLKGQERVISICRSLNASTYINPIGGLDLYRLDEFAEAGVDLKFLQSSEVSYTQFGGSFVPWLSIIDILMFNSIDQTKHFIQNQFELI